MTKKTAVTKLRIKMGKEKAKKMSEERQKLRIAQKGLWDYVEKI